MINGEVKGDEKVIENLKSMPPKIHAKVSTAVMRLLIDLHSHIVRTKLSGQVLHRRTGTLARSIIKNFQESSTTIIGIVASRASDNKPVVYAAIHEYGFHGVVTVKEHLRMQTMAWGKSITPKQVTVKAHQMTMNMPERSYMRSSLKDLSVRIRADIKKAAQDGAKL